jgi:outer membrane protein
MKMQKILRRRKTITPMAANLLLHMLYIYFKIRSMKKIIFVLLFFIGLFTGTKSTAQTKLAVVSADEIFAAMPEVLKADSLIAAYQQALAEMYQQQQTDLNEAYAKFVKDSARMTPAVKEARRKDLQDRITDLQNKEQTLNKDLETEKERQLKPIREKMLKAIQEVAKENGFTHVAYKEQLIVFPAMDDITDKVKKKLGAK